MLNILANDFGDNRLTIYCQYTTIATNTFMIMMIVISITITITITIIISINFQRVLSVTTG